MTESHEEKKLSTNVELTTVCCAEQREFFSLQKYFFCVLICFQAAKLLGKIIPNFYLEPIDENPRILYF